MTKLTYFTSGQRSPGKPRAILYPELYDMDWIKAHTHMTTREICALLGCRHAVVERARARLRASVTPAPGTARRKVRERIRQGVR